jgi:hypothetical protein
MSNEGKACDAIIRILEERTGEMRANVRRSENTQGIPPVEVDFQLGEDHFALEHTMLQTFAKQTYSAKQFYDLALDVVEKLSGQLPKPGAYKLSFPTFTTVGKSMSLERARAVLRQWVVSAASELHAAHPERRPRNYEPHVHQAFATASPGGLPFEVSLSRQVHWNLDERFDGVLTLGRMGPDDLEQQRIVQMTQALDKKCPKLRKFKEAGARTVLVLEDADASLSNHVTVAEAFEAASVGRTDLPDEVYQISTSAGPWMVWQLKAGDTIDLSETYREFSESELSDVTSGS